MQLARLDFTLELRDTLPRLFVHDDAVVRERIEQQRPKAGFVERDEEAEIDAALLRPLLQLGADFRVLPLEQHSPAASRREAPVTTYPGRGWRRTAGPHHGMFFETRFPAY